VLARGRRQWLAFAGPVALVAVIVSWLVLLVAGWALLIWPQLDNAFRFPPGDRAQGGLDALYLSLVTISTLGFGEITPTTAATKLLLPLEAIIGFGLLTASLSWLLSLYPALSRRRSLAYDIFLLRRAERDGGLSLYDLEAETSGTQLGELTSRLVAVERDLTMYPIAYYFAEADERFSLAAAMPYLLELAERGMAPSAPVAVRLQATMLRQAIDDLATTASGDAAADTATALRRYANDHAHSGA
jgi:hypothetical protein